jgi:hypothetical protein
MEAAYFGFSSGGTLDKKEGMDSSFSGPGRTEQANCSIKNPNSPLSELPRVLVRFNHIASAIVNANHRIM